MEKGDNTNTIVYMLMGEVEEEVVSQKGNAKNKTNFVAEYFMASTSSKQIKASEFSKFFCFVCVCESFHLLFLDEIISRPQKNYLPEGFSDGA